MRRGILVISASMGAGHDGAAGELQHRLEARGHSVRVVDYLDMIPLRLGGFVRWTYLFQLQRLSWTYDLTYQALNRGLGGLMWTPVVRFMSLVTRRALRRELERARPDAVVSTYPLASLVLGRLRKQRRLHVPVATFLTDFAVHSLWVHPGVDLHLAVSPSSAETAARRGGRTTRASGPLVGTLFRHHKHEREEIRHNLGIEAHERAVLVVAGSWGVGDVPATLEAVSGCGEQYHPITVCGKDDKLRASLLEQGVGGTVLGWTDDMPALMAAADALVENAGGLSAMEAFATGLPVITFHPIAGHGKDNAAFMAGSGVSRYARDRDDLAVALAETTTPGAAREAMIAAGHALFAGDPADDIVELASSTRAHALLTPVRTPRARRRVGVAAAMLAATYFVFTTGAHGVAALGVGVAKPPKGVVERVYVGVRVNEHELRDDRVITAISAASMTLVVDARTARHGGTRLADLAATGVRIANGGWGKGRVLRWQRARDDCERSWRVIASISGEQIRDFAPGRALDAFDQLYCRTGDHKQQLVRADVTFDSDHIPDPADLTIYLIEGRHGSPESLARAVDVFEQRVADRGLEIHPFEELR